MFFLELNFKKFLLESQTISQALKMPTDYHPVGIKALKVYFKNNLSSKYALFKKPQGLKQIDKIVNFLVYRILEDNKNAPGTQKLLQSLANEKNPTRIGEEYIKLANFAQINRWLTDSIDYILAMIQTGNAMALNKFNQPEYTFANLIDDSEHWHQAMAAKKRVPGPEGTVILNLNKVPGFKGWNWISLDRGYCRDEGNAGGHCGNEAVKDGDNILSLRDPENKVHATFIVNGKVLGEMKGHGNHKPSKKLHPAIIALLESPYVEAIRGGGYKPEANFNLSDLDENQRNSLLKKKPDIGSWVNYAIKTGNTDEITDAFGFSYYEGEGPKIVGDIWTMKTYNSIVELNDFVKGDLEYYFGEDSYEAFEVYYSTKDLSSSELSYNLNENVESLIMQYAKENAEDANDPEEEIHSVEEAIDQFDELKDVLVAAYSDGVRSGNEAQAWKKLERTLEDAEDVVGFWIDIKKHPFKLKIDTQSIQDFFNDNEKVELLEHYGNDVADMIQNESQDWKFEPSNGYGWDGFDKEYYNERAEEAIRHEL